MRLSTKSRYAVTSLLDVVMHSEEGPVSLADISKRQGVSLSYLEQLFSKMRRHDLVISTRGPGGGYLLSREPGEINIADVVQSVDEELKVFNKDALEGGVSFEPCLTETLWDELSDEIMGYLSGITLAEIIISHQKEKASLAV
ncbi:MAG: Rrf2 family transcriptional regulator [Gammaproteobacteria bacterium]|nr:Rrf2 family transcriptional regulator [Gammaproteobacteria bacterium]